MRIRWLWPWRRRRATRLRLSFELVPVFHFVIEEGEEMPLQSCQVGFKILCHAAGGTDDPSVVLPLPAPLVVTLNGNPVALEADGASFFIGGSAADFPAGEYTYNVECGSLPGEQVILTVTPPPPPTATRIALTFDPPVPA